MYTLVQKISAKQIETNFIWLLSWNANKLHFFCELKNDISFLSLELNENQGSLACLHTFKDLCPRARSATLSIIST